jgi:large subunit ribosomal protein L4
VATLKKYNLTGKQTGECAVSAAISESKANSQSIKDYIVALRANARQWSASTKDRSEVNHTGKKPHRQKGLGRARQGSLASPQYKGGGRVHAPRPKFDQHVRINRKERRQAISALLAEKIQEKRVIVLEDPVLEAPKTKTFAQFLKAAGLTGRVLFVGEGAYLEMKAEIKTDKANSGEENPIRISIPSDKHEITTMSLRNLPKTDFVLAMNMNGYDLLAAHSVVITESALKEIEARGA